MLCWFDRLQSYTTFAFCHRHSHFLVSWWFWLFRVSTKKKTKSFVFNMFYFFFIFNSNLATTTPFKYLSDAERGWWMIILLSRKKRQKKTTTITSTQDRFNMYDDVLFLSNSYLSMACLTKNESCISLSLSHTYLLYAKSNHTFISSIHTLFCLEKNI